VRATISDAIAAMIRGARPGDVDAIAELYERPFGTLTAPSCSWSGFRAALPDGQARVEILDLKRAGGSC
jgi:hypothetical protein